MSVVGGLGCGGCWRSSQEEVGAGRGWEDRRPQPGLRPCVRGRPWARPCCCLTLPAPEVLTLKSNFNNLINYIMCFISWSE